MKKFIIFFMALILAIPAAGLAEHSTDDYSWLDDLTINQLKELDRQIRQRLPKETEETEKTEETEETKDGAENSLFNLLFGSAGSKTETEALPLSVGEKISLDFCDFEILEIKFVRTKKNSPSGWKKVTGHGLSESFDIDSDCSMMAIFYKVKNKSNTAEWFWPSNLNIKVRWGDYIFTKNSGGPFGDLQCTQTKNYVAVIVIPNNILEAGCDDIVIDMGFDDLFKTGLSDPEKNDHRYILHTKY